MFNRGDLGVLTNQNGNPGYIEVMIIKDTEIYVIELRYSNFMNTAGGR